jgi:glycine/D-amino acid oxidase-like deaminating enzyme
MLTAAGWGVRSAAGAGEAEALPRAPGPHVAVIGAGAFGGWTALALRRAGARVTLLDAWGPGNARASSGGETRVIRGMYGPDRIYVEWVVRSFALWRDAEERWGQPLYRRTGALWLFQGDDGYARHSLPLLAGAGLPVETPSLEEAAKRWPQISFEDVRVVYLEREAGYLAARQACQAVARGLVAEGGELSLLGARPLAGVGETLAGLALSDGTELAADAYVFACGPWLGEVFPELAALVQPTRQEVFFFGPPAGIPDYDEDHLPVWVDFGERVFYGIPGNHYRGFKVADDSRGAPIDPTAAERTVTPEALDLARRELARRFPSLAGAPLLEARVCQYENSPDGDFVLDRHPGFANVWLAGGGSGHGFKMGPAVGEHVADLVLGRATPLAQFALARFPDTLEDRIKSQFKSGEEG